MKKKFATIPITQDYQKGEELETFCKRVDDMVNATLLSLEAIDIDVQYDYSAGVAFIKIWYYISSSDFLNKTPGIVAFAG